MRIGLISDTHIPDVGKELPSEVAGVFQGVDLILHAGDIYVLKVLDWLEEIAPVAAALGDDDLWFYPDPRVKRTQVVESDGLRIGLSHDIPLPKEPPWCTVEKILKRYFGSLVDIVVSGHTHNAAIQHYKGLLLINPGSATFPRYFPKLGTVALLEVEDGKAEARIIQLG